MFRIRKILDESAPANRDAIAQVDAINREQFPGWEPFDFEKLPQRLRDPMHHRYRSILLVAENASGKLRAYAVLLHMPDPGVVFLDLISTAPERTGGGIGAALYERVREEAAALGARQLYFECSVDDPAVCEGETLLQNQRRLRFYERYGARPIIHNDYATPVRSGDRDLYFLMLDPLGDSAAPRRDTVRKAARAILERRYGHLFDAARIEQIVSSFKDDPVQLRPPRYLRATAPEAPPPRVNGHGIALFVNEQHNIHHVRDRGYVEAPVRIPVIRSEIDKTGLFTELKPQRTPEALLRKVHEPAYVDYLRSACAELPAGKSIYPIIFPVRNQTRPPKDIELALGYYCTDTFTPLHRNADLAARGAVDCAVSGARALLAEHRLAYALVRPPGHHAERRVYGGFCYLNSSAIAAEFLSDYGRVAILDIDFHHGNGTQDIFYARGDVFTVSIHGAPPAAYPHYGGFEDERGEGTGAGRNLNLPLPEAITPERYHRTLARALRAITDFAPAHLVIAFGLDTAKSDPTGSWPLLADDFSQIGRAIGALKQPTLVVQEGGYLTRTLGINARHFFEGLWQTHSA